MDEKLTNKLRKYEQAKLFKPFHSDKKTGFSRQIVHRVKYSFIFYPLALALVFGFYVLKNQPLVLSKYQAPEVANKASSKELSSLISNNYTVDCQAKQHCDQMTSCREAQAYLRQCPVNQLDGDADGIPCELRLCKSPKW